MPTLLDRTIGIHSLDFVAVALLVCTITSITAAILLRRTQELSGSVKLAHAALLAGVAGLGAWATHFIAMLGYRPDAVLSFDPTVTGLSALAGIVLIGGPLAGSCVVRRRPAKVVAGLGAGAGIGAMHFIGMAALQECIAFYDITTILIALLLGMGCFAGALGLGRWPGSGVARAVLIAAGVCALHFTAMAGVRIEVLQEGTDAASNRDVISTLIAIASLILSVAAAVAVGTARRIEVRRRLAAEREASRNRVFSVALRNMSNGLVMLDENQKISIYNDRLLELFRLNPSDLETGMGFEDFLRAVACRNEWGPARLARVLSLHTAWMQHEGKQITEDQFDDGRVVSISFNRMSDGGGIVTYDDLTAHRAAQRAAAHAATHDSLTGLPNRDSFRERIERLLTTNEFVAILMLDLNRFKTVNEALGQTMGDALLVEVSRRLAAALKPGGIVYRLGGDEMAVLPYAADAETAHREAEHLRRLFEEPFVIGAHTVSITASIGLAVSEPGDTLQQLIQKADLTLYRAKELRRDQVEVYEDGLLEQAVERRELETDLRRALREGELSLNYQPLYHLPDRRLIGFEALIRWTHPEKGMISPAQFIPLAEANGTIHEIGKWVLDTACHQAARWPTPLHVAVNVSPVQMRSPDMVETVAAALERNGLAPSRLELELTETALVEDGYQISRTLRELRALGVWIAMDDFGTGYSSLTHLRDFELDRIKIDRSFVDTETSDRGAHAVVRAVTSMARDLSILTLGEGVETEEQLGRLISLGCDAAQGFLLGRPLDAQDADRLISLRVFEADAASDREEIRPTGT